MTPVSASAKTTAPHVSGSCPSTAARTLLEQLAVETETRIHETSQFQMRYGETTITDNNLLAIRRANLPNIRVFHVPPLRERDFGYDWEWWIRVGNTPWTVLFVQAKKLNPKKGTYDSLAHRVPGTKQLQIDLLWQHAHQLGGIPVYSFYNGPRPAVTAWNCQSSRDDQQFGCSIVPLHIVRGFISAGRHRRMFRGRKHTDFERLHENDHAIPWRCLVCATVSGGGRTLFASLASPGIQLREYPELPYYLRQVIDAEREYVRVREYPSSTGMFPRNIAVISIEPPTAVTPAQLPAPQAGDLPSLSEIAATIAKKSRSKVLA